MAIFYVKAGWNHHRWHTLSLERKGNPNLQRPAWMLCVQLKLSWTWDNWNKVTGILPHSFITAGVSAALILDVDRQLLTHVHLCDTTETQVFSSVWYTTAQRYHTAGDRGDICLVLRNLRWPFKRLRDTHSTSSIWHSRCCTAIG